MPREKDVLTTGEVAKICNVAPRTVSKWFDSGQLRGYRIPGSKDRRIPLNSLVRFMKAHGIPLDGIVSGQTRVLVFDKEQEVGEVLCKLLTEHAEYEVHTTMSPFLAGMECERFRPGVFLLDIDLEDGMGRAICNAIRNQEDLQMTRIIAMSSKMTDGQIHQMKAQGFDAILKKPFNLRQAIKTIEDVLAFTY